MPIRSGLESHGDTERPITETAQGLAKSSKRQRIHRRRSRNGCLTCRNRRIKCDQAKPICEKCLKSQRNCIWPMQLRETRYVQARARTKSLNAKSTNDHVDDHIHKDLTGHADLHASMRRPGAHDEEQASFAARVSSLFSPPPGVADLSVTSERQASSPVHLHEPQNARSMPQKSIVDSITNSPEWHNLQPSVRTLLSYHRSNLSFRHYGWKHDEADFLKTTFIKRALSFEPLLYSVVAFAAYHRALHFESHNMEDFLAAYTRSITLLRNSLAEVSRDSLSTILTILQFAAIERYLENSANLRQHRQAASQLISVHGIRENAERSEMHKAIVDWHMQLYEFAPAEPSLIEDDFMLKWMA